MLSATSWFNHLTRFRWPIALVLTGVVAWADYYTGAFVTFSAFYLAPLFLIAWQGRRLDSQCLILLIVSAWTYANYSSNPEHYTVHILLWNLAVRWLHLTLTAELVHFVSRSYIRNKQLALTDPLTGLNNRRAFMHLVEDAISRQRNSTPLLALLMVDVDHFKQMNDSHGHAFGDEQLQRVSHILQSRCADCEFCGRLGGDEFALVWFGSDATILTERIKQLAANLNAMAVPCSIGAGILKQDPIATSQAFELADQALYQSKVHGRAQATVVQR